MEFFEKRPVRAVFMFIVKQRSGSLRRGVCMKVDDVPQDRGMMGDNKAVYEVCYAVGENGQYKLIPSAGWEPKNIANDQAWEVIHRQVEETLIKVNAGDLSTLAYHMVKNQMNVSLLAKYAAISRWRVQRHLKPAVFQKLDSAILKRYADVFGLSVEQLCAVPQRTNSGELENQKDLGTK